jgi:hypothetical protein
MALNKDMNGVYGQLAWKHFREDLRHSEFLFVSVADIFKHNGDIVTGIVIIVIIIVRDGDFPEGELVCIDTAELIALLGLDEFPEVIDCLCLIDVNREGLGSSRSVDKTKQA